MIKAFFNCSYISEKNHYFLDEVNMSDNYNNLSSFLKPPMTVSTKHDFCSGSKNSHTPLRHNIIYRNFYYVSSGKVTIKLIPPKDAFLLHGHKDYDLFEFSSPINPWNVSKEYVNDFQNVNHMDIELTEGDILYIPAYWWYSIRYDEISSLCVFQYKTFMNVLAIAPELIMYFLQTQNTTHKTEKTIDDILVNTTKNNNETSSKKENVSKNKDLAEEYKAKIEDVTRLVTLYVQAVSCGLTADASCYLTDIKNISECGTECKCYGDNSVPTNIPIVSTTNTRSFVLETSSNISTLFI